MNSSPFPGGSPFAPVVQYPAPVSSYPPGCAPVAEEIDSQRKVPNWGQPGHPMRVKFGSYDLGEIALAHTLLIGKNPLYRHLPTGQGPYIELIAHLYDIEFDHAPIPTIETAAAMNIFVNATICADLVYNMAYSDSGVPNEQCPF